MGDCCFPLAFVPVRRREKREWGENKSTRVDDDWGSIGEEEAKKKGERERSLEQSSSLRDTMMREKRRGGETEGEREEKTSSRNHWGFLLESKKRAKVLSRQLTQSGDNKAGQRRKRINSFCLSLLVLHVLQWYIEIKNDGYN